MTLRAAERARWDGDGYFVRRDVLTPDEVVRLREAAEDVVARVIAHAERPDAGPEMLLADGHRIQFSSRTAIQWEWRSGSREIRLLEPVTHLDGRLSRLWDDPRLVAPMRDALGQDDVGPYTCKLNLKRPRDGSRFPWHQDFPYWYAFAGDRARDIATAIVFLDDASVENGAIRVLPGSHRGGPARRDPDDPTGFLADPAHIDAEREVAVEVLAGSVLLLSSLLLHRSSMNTSSHHRRALLLSFQPAGRPRQVELDWRPERVHELP
jgi:ectoine hydroxylase-related dioxygenase (phytanoyl-CoA dioxygenase family)